MRILYGRENQDGEFRLRQIDRAMPGESQADAIIRAASEYFEVPFDKKTAFFRCKNGKNHGGSIGRFRYRWNEQWDAKNGGALFVETKKNLWVFETRNE